MKKTVKILAILILAIMLITMVSNVFAVVDPSTITPNTNNTNKVQNIGKQIAGFVQVIGSIAAVVVLIVLGIKYMLGSAEEKAEYKKTMIPYVIGAVLVFAAANLAGMIFNFANNIT